MVGLPQTKNAGIAAGAKQSPIACAQCRQNAATEIIPMMVASTNPTSTGWIFGVAPRDTSETFSGGSASGSGFCVMALMVAQLGKEIATGRCEKQRAARGRDGKRVTHGPAGDAHARRFRSRR
jgi:hypothetical protein